MNEDVYYVFVVLGGTSHAFEDLDLKLRRSKEMSKPLVFLSYCHENTVNIQRLKDDLENAGCDTWWDQNILPGEDWELKIRQAIKRSDIFLFCISKESQKKSKSGIYPEAAIAIEELQKCHPGQIFFIPVRLSDCEVPLFKIGGGTWLDSLQWVDLFPRKNWQAGVAKILSSIQKATGSP